MPLYRFLIVLFLVINLSFIASCTSTRHMSESSDGLVESETSEAADEGGNDPFEGLNRAIFSFNLKVDSWLSKPIAKGYRWITPDPVETGIGNFFYNLGDVRNIFNDILQWKWKRASIDSGRFVINSTLGLFGIFDVAGKLGLERSDGEDFAQTLAKWGVPQGPYIVIPFLGSSTIASGLSFPVDTVTHPTYYVEPQEASNVLTASELVHQRAQLLDVEELASGDFYIFVRDAYLQRREYLINDGDVEDDFGGDFDDEDFDF